MKPETASALFAPIQESLGLTPTFEFTFQLQKFLEGFANFLAPVKTTSTMDEFMAAMPEPPEKELPMIVAMTGLLPALLRDFMVKGSEIAKRDLPSEKQGRPKALTIEEQQKIVAKIGSLHTCGVRLGHAMQRAAQEFDVSIQTIRRTWSKRGTLPGLPAPTVQDVWRAFASGFDDKPAP